MNINTNISALTALSDHRKAFLLSSQSMERLSSGLRINKGADDPSGMGIAELTRAAIRGTQVAIENAQETVLMLRAGADGMNQIQTILRRMRDLAVRASNEATLTVNDRINIDNEFQSLVQEVTRTAKGTKSVGNTPLYWPDTGSADIMYVFDTTQSMGTAINTARNQLGSFITALADASVDWGIGLVDFRDQDVVAAMGSARAPIFYNLTTVQATAQGYLNLMAASGGGDTAESALEALDMARTSTTWRYALGTPNYTRQIILVTDADFHDDAAGAYAGDGFSALDAQTVANTLAAAGVTVNVGGDPALQQHIIMSTTTGGVLGAIGSLSTVLTQVQEDIATDLIAPVADRTRSIQVTPNSTDYAQFVFEDCRAGTLGVSGLSITSVAGARQAITGVDGAINTLATHQVEYGVMDRRLAGIVSDLSTKMINDSAAKSQIIDADMAAEAAKLVKSQILEDTSGRVLKIAGAVQGRILDVIRLHNLGKQ